MIPSKDYETKMTIILGTKHFLSAKYIAGYLLDGESANEVWDSLRDCRILYEPIDWMVN